MILADLAADGFHGIHDESGAVPTEFGVANSENKIAENVGAALGMQNFGMKLHGVDSARRVFRGGDGAACFASDSESWRQRARAPRKLR